MTKTQEILNQIQEEAQKKWQEAPKNKVEKNVTVEVDTIVSYEGTEKYLDKKRGVVGLGGRPFLGIIGPRERIMGWIPVEKERKCTNYKTERVEREISKVFEIDPEFEPFLE